MSFLMFSFPTKLSHMTFEDAVQAVNDLPNLSDATRLQLYGLYKVSTVGQNDTAKPGFFNPVGAAKWNAWTNVSHISQDEAIEMYIKTVEGLKGNTDQRDSGVGVKVSTMCAPEPAGISYNLLIC
jgi:acyl-CoA-binding protein